MKAHKQILLATLVIAFPAAIISMEHVIDKPANTNNIIVIPDKKTKDTFDYASAIKNMQAAVAQTEKENFKYEDTNLQINVALTNHKEMLAHLKAKTDLIVLFAQYKKHDTKYIHFLANWIKKQRKRIDDINVWHTLIDELIGQTQRYNCTPFQKKIIDAVAVAVKNIAYNLQPGESCSKILVYQAQQALVTEKLKFPQPKPKNDLNII